MSDIPSVLRQAAKHYRGDYVAPQMLEPNLQKRLEQIILQLTIPTSELTNISQNFYFELMNGLKAHKRHRNLWIPNECCFKMLDSYISNIPTGKEHGSYYAIDFGGSNCRAVRIKIHGNGKMERTQSTFTLKYSSVLGPKGLLDQTATATELFDHFATEIGTVIKQSGDPLTPEEPLKVGFTFSFPCTMLSRNTAILLDWTKYFETGRATNDQVEGKDVGKLMDEAFKRNNINANVSIILNDTVGTLLSCAYQKPEDYPECRVGVILGTGFNICYAENDYENFGYVGKIINTECGNFDKELPITPVDFEIDYYTSNCGRRLLEKLIGAAYLGEIVRRYMILLLREKAPRVMWHIGTFTSVDGGEILNDPSEDHQVAKEIALRRWGVELSQEVLVGLHKICEFVFGRSAGLAAAAIAATARKACTFAKIRTTIAIDGSLYVKNEWYKNKLHEYLDQVIRPDLRGNVVLLASDDGSGKGAAIAAAMFDNRHFI
ncbi:hexokinase 1, putative [Theileria equi strain WA]|uniref:Phosphotransferase n=1 Tax=Theileria equi strain WA TaxID=1537102 RepID=L0B0X5_THEEQ|nr:hexokinase 1, putative [Theileria equi strain WA]AFZ80789.1 hexokinase 1, putative [Theileria equi strain WA]|eukprot:XP_004830455.1 hexokinase 1, putative [Theileria equi strain WA]